MSALMFISTPSAMQTCIGDCQFGKGRWLPMIMGKPLEDAPLCSKCKKRWEDQWTEALEQGSFAA